MKKILYSILMLCVYFPAMAQESEVYEEERSNRKYSDLSGNVSSEQEYTIYTSEYKQAQKTMSDFISQKNYTIIKQEESKTSQHFNFYIPPADFKSVDSLVSTLGYISSKQLKSVNNLGKLEESKIDLEHLEKKKMEYELMVKKIDSLKSDKYFQYWEKVRGIDSEIYALKKRIKNLESGIKILEIEVRIYDEQVNPTNNRVNFVHMPGAEYSYLFIEEPKVGITHDTYQGVMLKYLFTKGKSSFSLGAFKASDAKKDTLTFDEMFLLSFGQDFYSRYFGRGTRKFMNLYVGYNVGGALLSNDYNRSKVIPFVSPGLGVELFKNKYLLIDVGSSYFLPLTEDNRNVRGFKVSSSINFVF